MEKGRTEKRKKQNETLMTKYQLTTMILSNTKKLYFYFQKYNYKMCHKIVKLSLQMGSYDPAFDSIQLEDNISGTMPRI